MGADPIRAIKMGTFNAAQYFGLKDRGAVMPGLRADLAVLEDLKEFRVAAVYKNGVLTAREGVCLGAGKDMGSAGKTASDLEAAFPSVFDSFRMDEITLEDLVLEQKGTMERVIQFKPHELLTEERLVPWQDTPGLAPGVSLEQDIVKAGCPGMNGINSSGAHEINALGERFMGKYDPMMENGVRNNQIQGTFQEQMEGSGPPFYMDMRHVDKDVVHELQYVLMPGDKATFGDWADCTGTDFQHKLLEVEIGELIFGGTIAVNDTFETTVPNLFCGSIFLYCSGAMCGGYEAGRQAGMRAAGITEAGKINEDLAASVKKDVFAPMQVPADDGISYKEIEQATRNVMNYYMGFRRSMAGMARALEKIRFLSGQADRLHADTLRDLMRCHESRDILTVCELAIQATMERKETGRCVYKLRDYPELNPDMAKPLLLIRSEDGPRFQWGKAPLL